MDGEALPISDYPGLVDRPGSYLIDDEGVPACKTALVKEGVLSGRLHSRETAYAFGEALTGLKCKRQRVVCQTI